MPQSTGNFVEEMGFSFMSNRPRGKHRAPSQSRSRGLAARGVATAFLAAGLAGYGLTTASAASAAESTTASVAKKDCVKAGAAARFSFKPICPAEPPSKLEQGVQRGVSAVTSLGVSELERAAGDTVIDGRGQEGCTSAVAAHVSTRPLCKPRELEPYEKLLRKGMYVNPLGFGGLPTSAAKFAPEGLQAVEKFRGAGAVATEVAKKVDGAGHQDAAPAEAVAH
ncbi:hypothetical protein [Streptomyces sp. NPDC050485]|uniref:hypothetical protein n=1 Tax=Streptomyces sp. NPDC050485 TaxID=3365617 RepID=UPI0037B7F2CA